MKKEEIVLLAQLLTGMQDLLEAFEASYQKKDVEKARIIKKELIQFQSQINKII